MGSGLSEKWGEARGGAGRLCDSRDLSEQAVLKAYLLQFCE